MTLVDLLVWVLRLFLLLSYPPLCSCLGILLTFPAPYPLLCSCLGILLTFLFSYPLLCSCMGILLTFLALIPTTLLLPGYHAYFSCSIPTTLLLSGYLAYFSCSHTHYSALGWVSHLFFRLHTHYSALGWVSRLLFLLSYPLLCSCLGILLTFLALIPTTLLRAGYLAYFSYSHTHTFLLGWVSCLLFLLSYPLLCSCLGITLVSPAPYPLLCSCLGITLISPAPYPRRPTKTNIQNKEKGMYAKIKHTYPVYKKVNTKLYSILFLSQLVSYI